VTRRELFLQEMEGIVPWSTFESLIAPHYPKAGNVRHPMPLCVMLRIYFMQQWFQLSDPGMEDALYDSQSMQRFAGLEVGRDAIPDETTILHFRHLLEWHNLTEKMFSSVRDDLQSKDIIASRHDYRCHYHSCVRFHQESGEVAGQGKGRPCILAYNASSISCKITHDASLSFSTGKINC